MVAIQFQLCIQFNDMDCATHWTNNLNEHLYLIMLNEIEHCFYDTNYPITLT